MNSAKDKGNLFNVRGVLCWCVFVKFSTYTVKEPLGEVK